MGPIESFVFGWLEKPRTINEVVNLTGMSLRQVRPAVQRLVAGGYLVKIPTEGCGNHDMRYEIRRDWTDLPTKPKPRGKQGKAKPSKPKPKPKKKELTNVLGVWI